MISHDAGDLLIFTFVKDRSLPFYYAYGIRESTIYGIHFIRTSAIEMVDYEAKRIYTIFNNYRFFCHIDDPGYSDLLFDMFAHVITPALDHELIISTTTLTNH